MEKKIEFSTFLGILAAIALVVTAIASGNGVELSSFIDLPSILIVFGGTFFVTCASFTISDVIKALSVSSQTMFYASENRATLVADCLKLAEQSKKEGMLSIQKLKYIYEGMSSFFNKQLMMVVDGVNVSDSEKLMVQEIAAIKERHKKAVEILRKAAEVAPAMGLIGTLIGLVQMLGNLSDPSKIGPAMAVALLTTLYGAMTSYVVLLPLAAKLEKNSKDEIDLLKIYAEAVLGIARQDGPVRLEMKLNSYLPPEERVKIYS